MRAAILAHFPVLTHPLTVVSDPDRVLAEEEILVELERRGFRLAAEDDPVLLRLRVEQERPWTRERPLVVVTEGALRDLPYDLWHEGHRVELALHAFFPRLSYPVIQELTPDQRWRLSQAPPPEETLGENGAIVYVLRHVFGAVRDELRSPAGLIAWLNQYHGMTDPMPPQLADHILAWLRSEPVYARWPLTELLERGDAFTHFVQEQWRGYVQTESGHLLAEEAVDYILDFASDPGLQDDLAGLLRSGTLAPLGIAEPERLPAWARAGVLGTDDDARRQRIEMLVDDLRARVQPAAADVRWSDWQGIARSWAELQALRDANQAMSAPVDTARRELRDQIDGLFQNWLGRHYGPLAGQKLPVPHHVFHVPHFLAYERRQGRAERVALLVLDGLSLTDWSMIGPAWRARHPDWRFEERLLIAQVPTITAVSRQALISGLRPTDFAATIGGNTSEPGLWRAFWEREGVPSSATVYERLTLDRSEPPVAPGPHIHALCLIDFSIDEIVHGSSQGAAGVHAALGVWLDGGSLMIEAMVDRLLAHGYTIYLASDHGHVESRGIGQPSEGLAVETRGKRARIYPDAELAANAQRAYDQVVLWGRDGLLPEGYWALLAPNRSAFAPVNDVVVTHGGTTLEEVVVPFVAIRQA